MRRIQNVQKEMALKSPALKPPSARELAAACGYSYSGSDEGENDDPVQQLQEALDRGFAAREQLITANMGLVRHVVQAVVGTAKTLGREDLVQEGAIGLARAVDRWDPEIGGKFSTYAYYWIRATVLRGIAQRDELVRVPEHMRLAIGRLEKAAKTMGIAENFFSERRWRDAREAKELAEAAGLTTKQLDQACRVQERRRNTLSFEAWMEQGKDVSSSAMTGSSSSDPPMKASELLDLRGALAKFLRPKELEALSWRYGLTSDHEHERVTASLRKTMSPGGGRQRRTRDYVAEVEESLFGASSSGDDPRASVAVAGGGGVSIPSQGRFGEAMSFAEVGKRMKVSAEYTRQLCSSALDKLRRAAKEGELAEFALQC
jgi:RNA polymerase sigma factor (sigma-70 family)